MNDILVSSIDEEHLKHMRILFQRLNDYEIVINTLKFLAICSTLMVFGHHSRKIKGKAELHWIPEIEMAFQKASLLVYSQMDASDVNGV